MAPMKPYMLVGRRHDTARRNATTRLSDDATTRPDEMRPQACRSAPRHAPTKRHNSLIGQRLLNMAPTEPHDLLLANAMIWRQHKSLYHPLESAQRHQGIYLFIYLFIYFLYYSLGFLVFFFLALLSCCLLVLFCLSCYFPFATSPV